MEATAAASKQEQKGNLKAYFSQPALSPTDEPFASLMKESTLIVELTSRDHKSLKETQRHVANLWNALLANENRTDTDKQNYQKVSSTLRQAEELFSQLESDWKKASKALKVAEQKMKKHMDPDAVAWLDIATHLKTRMDQRARKTSQVSSSGEIPASEPLLFDVPQTVQLLVDNSEDEEEEEEDEDEDEDMQDAAKERQALLVERTHEGDRKRKRKMSDYVPKTGRPKKDGAKAETSQCSEWEYNKAVAKSFKMDGVSYAAGTLQNQLIYYDRNSKCARCKCCCVTLELGKGMKQHCFQNVAAKGTNEHQKKMLEYAEWEKHQATLLESVEAGFKKTGAIGITLTKRVKEYRASLMEGVADANISVESVEGLKSHLEKYSGISVGDVSDLKGLIPSLEEGEREELLRILGDGECFPEWSALLDGSPGNYMEAEAFMVRKVGFHCFRNTYLFILVQL